MGLLALLLVFVVAMAVAIAWDASGPAHDPELAERSFLAALRREHPREKRLSVSCDGLRDGSHFFGCQISGSRWLPSGAGVSYDDDTDEYRADAAGGEDGREPLVFRPAE